MLTESQLLNFRGMFLNEARAYKSLSKSIAKVSIFLSHSHKDKELVEGFINLLAYSMQILIYVDWLDSDMPATTNRETACRIKEKIEEMDYFLVLATRNAMASKWVPWEIGIADKTKPADRVAIIPIVDPYGNYHGNEYMQLYPRVSVGHHKQTGEEMLAVFDPNENSGTGIKYWLSP
jgi:hypothetical protein